MCGGGFSNLGSLDLQSKALNTELSVFRSCVVSRYHQLLDEIHLCYLDQREQLLSPSITSTISDLTSQNHKDHCALVRKERPRLCLCIARVEGEM